jgi:hypothetical protein
MRRVISREVWHQIKAAYAAGIGLKEIARNTNVPEGTVLARAKREGWTLQIAAAKQAAALPQSNAIAPLQSIAAVMQERGERYRERIAGVSERVVDYIEAMCPDEILARSTQFEKIDTIARPTFGLNEAPSCKGSLSLNILTNHSRRAGDRRRRVATANCRVDQGRDRDLVRHPWTPVNMSLVVMRYSYANCDDQAIQEGNGWEGIRNPWNSFQRTYFDQTRFRLRGRHASARTQSANVPGNGAVDEYPGHDAHSASSSFPKERSGEEEAA